MSHPMNHLRAHKVEKSRVGKLYRASGGKIPYGSEEDSDFAGDGQITRDKAHLGSRGVLKGQGKSPSVHKAGGHVHGKKGKHRMDRKRASGGRAPPPPPPKDDPYEERANITRRAKGGKVKGKTVINIMVGKGGDDKPPMPMMPPPPPHPMMPPPGPPPGAGAPPPGGPPGMPPPGMGPPGPPMMRKRGGSVKHAAASPMQGKGMKQAKVIGRASARDEAAPPGPTGVGDKMPGQPPSWEQSEKFKTKVQHTDGKTDGPDIGRGKPITYKRGGAVNSLGVGRNPPAGAMNGKGRTSVATPPAFSGGDHTSRAVKAAKAGSYPIKSGGKGGMARLEKARKAGPHGAP